jgi:hypothetical protein
MHTDTDTTIPTDLSISISSDGAAPSQYFRIDGRKLIINDDLEWSEYVSGMALFKKLNSDLKLYYSQYVAFGQLKFGAERINACMAQLEFDLDDAKKAVEIASIPEDIRHDNLKAEHYIALSRSGLKKRDMAKWSKIASEQNLTAGQLKVSIQHGEVITETQARQENHGTLSLHGISMSVEVWLRRAGGLDALRKKPADERKMLAEQLKLAVDIHKALTEAPRKPKKKTRKPAAKRKAKK